MCCKLEQAALELWFVYYENEVVASIYPSNLDQKLIIRYSMGVAKLAACKVEFIRGWAKDQITMLNITRKLTR